MSAAASSASAFGGGLAGVPPELGRLIAGVALDDVSGAAASCPLAVFMRHIHAEWRAVPSLTLREVVEARARHYTCETERLARQADQCRIARDKLHAELQRVAAQIEQIERDARDNRAHQLLCSAALAVGATEDTRSYPDAFHQQQHQQQQLEHGASAAREGSYGSGSDGGGYVLSAVAAGGHGSGVGVGAGAGRNAGGRNDGSGASSPAPDPPLPPLHASPSPTGAGVNGSTTHVVVNTSTNGDGNSTINISTAQQSSGPASDMDAAFNVLRIRDARETTVVHALSRCETHCLAQCDAPWATPDEHDRAVRLAVQLVRHLPTPRPPVQAIELRILASLLRRGEALPVPSGSAAMESAVLGEGAAAALASLLSSVNEDVKGEALAVLAELLKSAPGREDFVRAGGVAPLMAIVATSVNEAMLDTALVVTWRAAILDAGKAQIRQADGVRGLVDLLYTDSVSLLSSVLQALAYVTREEAGKITMKECAGLEKIVATLYHPSQSVQSKAASVIWNCADNEECRVALRSLGSAAALTELLASSSLDVLESVSGALANVSLDAAARLQLVEYGGLPFVIALLGSESPQVVANLSAVLWNCSSVTELRTAIRKSGGIAPLVSLLRHSNGVVQANVSGAMRNLVINDQNKAAFREASGFEVVLELLPHANPVVLDRLVSTLWTATIASDNKHAIRACSGGFAKIVALLRSPVPAIVDKALGTLRNCSTAAENRQPMVDAGVIAAIVAVFPNPAAILRMPLESKETIAQTVWNLAREGKAAAVREGALQLMAALLADSHQVTVELAAGAISSMTVNNAEAKEMLRQVDGVTRLAQLLARAAAADGGGGADASPVVPYTLHNVLLAMRNATATNEANQIAATTADAASSLLQIIRVYSTAPPATNADAAAGTTDVAENIIRESVLCVKNLCGPRRGLDEVARGGGAALMRELAEKGKSDSVRKAAVMALQPLATPFGRA